MHNRYQKRDIALVPGWDAMPPMHFKASKRSYSQLVIGFVIPQRSEAMTRNGGMLNNNALSHCLKELKNVQKGPIFHQIIEQKSTTTVHCFKNSRLV